MIFNDVHAVAQYFIAKSRPERYADNGTLLENYKLQKMLYLSQGFHMLLFGRPLFSEPLVAHTHGPVVPSVWYKYDRLYNNSSFNPHGVNIRYNFDRERITPIPLAGTLPKDVEMYLDDVWSVFGHVGGGKLERMLKDTGHALWYDKINADPSAEMVEIPMHEINHFFNAQFDIEKLIPVLTRWRHAGRYQSETRAESNLRYGFKKPATKIE